MASSQSSSTRSRSSDGGRSDMGSLCSEGSTSVGELMTDDKVREVEEGVLGEGIRASGGAPFEWIAPPVLGFTRGGNRSEWSRRAPDFPCSTTSVITTD